MRSVWCDEESWPERRLSANSTLCDGFIYDVDGQPWMTRPGTSLRRAGLTQAYHLRCECECHRG